MIHAKQLRGMGTPPSFFAMFSKGDNFRDFLFAYLEEEIFPKWGLLLKERLCSDGDKFFFSLRVDPEADGRKNRNDELLPLKVYPFTLKRQFRINCNPAELLFYQKPMCGGCDTVSIRLSRV